MNHNKLTCNVLANCATSHDAALNTGSAHQSVYSHHYIPTVQTKLCILNTPVTTNPASCGLQERTPLAPRNRVLDEVQIPHGKGQFWGGRERRPIVKYRDTLRWSMQKWLKRSGCRLDWGLRWAQGKYIRLGPDPPMAKSNFKDRRAHCKYRDILPWAVQERLNRWICRLDGGLG